MVYVINLLVRKTIYGSGKHPKLRLQSNIKLSAENLESPTANIDIIKGLGNSAVISRTEHAFVKFLLSNYGDGKYTIIRVDGRFKSFFNAFIEGDRWVREKGKISPYLKSSTPKRWHPISERPIRTD